VLVNGGGEMFQRRRRACSSRRVRFEGYGLVRDCVAFGRGPIEHIRGKSGFPAFSFAHRNRLNGVSSGVGRDRAIDGGDADGGGHQRSRGVLSVHSS
jgi:hypothetical protein